MEKIVLENFLKALKLSYSPSFSSSNVEIKKLNHFCKTIEQISIQFTVFNLPLSNLPFIRLLSILLKFWDFVQVCSLTKVFNVSSS